MLCLVTIPLVAYLFNSFWIHRFDVLIAEQAPIYKLEERLVWSVIYQETYFRPWMIGADEEIGLMQVTPTVVRMWAKETGLKELERQAAEDPKTLMTHPRNNIQAGCWYLWKVRQKYRGAPAELAMALAAYNAGPSRVEDWTEGVDAMKVTEEDFVARIEIESTRRYVTEILARYRD